MRKVLLALAAFTPLAFAQVQSFTYTYGGLAIPIYPNDWNTISVVRIPVSRSISVSHVSVTVQVQYSGVGDLNMYLYSAYGTRTKLLERNCGNLVNIDTSFDDNAPSKYADYCPVTAGQGPFRGNEPLSNSSGENAYGYWRLAIENNGSTNTGLVTGFSITITGTALGTPILAPNTVVSVSSFDNGTIAPGDQVGLFGLSLGPTTGVRATAGVNWPTTLAGTTVTFDGATAPVYYVSDKFVIVQAPTTLNPGATTKIQVASSAGNSNTISLPVVPVKPGIFTREASGKGQAIAYNADGSLNGDGSIHSTDLPAPAGSTIQVYASGLGAVNPAIQTGIVAPSKPASPTTGTVTATVGGQSATVVSAVAAPGRVGAYLVTVTLPNKMLSGPARIVLSTGGVSSQDGVFVQIK